VAVIDENLTDDLLENIKNIPSVKIIKVEELKKLLDEKKRNFGFSKLLALTSVESKIKPFERKLAPKGLFPNKKNGLLTENILEKIDIMMKGEKEYKTDKGGNIHTLIGRSDLEISQLEENFLKLSKDIFSIRPAG
jgi:large subunit ribosomal protein L1